MSRTRTAQRPAILAIVIASTHLAPPALAMASTLKGTVVTASARDAGKGTGEVKAARPLAYWRVENGVLPVQPPIPESREGVVIVLEPEVKGPTAPPPETPVVIEARPRRFEPSVLVAMPGTPLKLHNADKVARSFFLVDGERYFPRQATPADGTREVKFSVPGEYRITDVDNPRKQAIVLVLVSAGSTSTDDKGAFSIDVPDGKYTLRAFYRGAWAASQPVEVGAASRKGDVTVKLAAPGEPSSPGGADGAVAAPPTEAGDKK